MGHVGRGTDKGWDMRCVSGMTILRLGNEISPSKGLGVFRAVDTRLSRLTSETLCWGGSAYQSAYRTVRQVLGLERVLVTVRSEPEFFVHCLEENFIVQTQHVLGDESEDEWEDE